MKGILGSFVVPNYLHMNIYILLAHPDKDSFNGALAEAYKQKAMQCGHEVRIQQLGDLQFDPILHKGFKEVQPLEPDLIAAQEYIQWCHHWVIIYPIWWGAVPALLKGFFDRVLLPGFAFKYHATGPWWDMLLSGKTAEIITTSDAPQLYIWLKYGNSDLKSVRTATLAYCGIKTTKTTRIDRLRFLTPEQRENAIKKAVMGIK